MKSRGWQRERVVWTVDTTGAKVAVFTGVVTDQHGRLVAVLAVGNGPSVVLNRAEDGSVHGQVSLNAMVTLLDVEEMQARAEIERHRGPR